MNIFNIAPYICSASICFSMALTLLFVNSNNATENAAYQRIKYNLAYSALIDVFIDILSIILLLNGKDIFILDSFVVPTAYYLELFFMTKAVLGLIHFVPKRNLSDLWYIIPCAILVAMYSIGYCISGNSELPHDFFVSFSEYHNTLFSKICCITMTTLVGFAFFQSLYILIFYTIQYVWKLNNYYSGEEVTNGKQISYISYCFVGYFVLAAIDFLFSNESLDPFFMIFNTSLFLFVAIVVINLQNTYNNTNKLDDFNIEKNNESAVLESIFNPNMTTNYTTTESEYHEDHIIKAIHLWENLDSKPYLKDGILIADVAQELGITAIQLSFILNHSLRINFNTWINKLRIEESKRIMNKDPQITITGVALSSGFKDTACYSKTFKKITGESPTTYKKSLTN